MRFILMYTPGRDTTIQGEVQVEADSAEWAAIKFYTTPPNLGSKLACMWGTCNESAKLAMAFNERAWPDKYTGLREMNERHGEASGTMYAEVRATVTEADEDLAREIAVHLIVLGGFDGNDSDRLGEAHGGIVQSLLMIALMRSPDMTERLNEFLNDK